MGKPKLSLPLGGRTVLEHVVSAVMVGGVESVVVVVGPGDQELPTLGRKAGAAVVQLPADTAEMRETVQHGLDWVEKEFHPAASDGWLLLPADHPCIDHTVVTQLLVARDRQPDRSIFVPTFQGQRGHPAWIGWRHVAAIRAMPHGTGLNTYLRQHCQDTIEVPVETPSVLWDLDTPEDYQRLLGQ